MAEQATQKFQAATPSSAPGAMPTLADVSPRFAKIAEKNRQFRARLEAIEDELRPIAKELAKLPAAVAQSRSPTRVDVIEPSPRAKQLLGDLSPAPREEVRNAPHPLRARAAELDDEQRAISEAAEALEPESRRARHAASIDLAAAVGARYDAVVARLLSAIVELGDAKIAHVEFVRSFQRTGAQIAALRVANDVEILGDPRDDGTPLRLALARAVEIGRCDPAILLRWRK